MANIQHSLQKSTSLNFFLYLKLRFPGGFVPFMNKSLISRHLPGMSIYTFNTNINRLDDDIAVRETKGWRLAGMKSVFGKRNRLKHNISKNSSWNEFNEKLFLFQIGCITHNQEYNIMLKGGKVKGRDVSLNKIKKYYRDNHRNGMPVSEPWNVMLTTRMIARLIGRSQSWVSIKLRNLRDKGVIIYKSIKVRLSEYIPSKYHYLFPEYLYNHKGYTIEHKGSSVVVI